MERLRNWPGVELEFAKAGGALGDGAAGRTKGAPSCEGSVACGWGVRAGEELWAWAATRDPAERKSASARTRRRPGRGNCEAS